MRLRKNVRIGILSLPILFQPLLLQAQKSAADATADEILLLSPFVVSSEADQGYRAQQTMVGTRSTKNVIDIAGSVAIFNRELIEDLGATSLHDLVRFAVSGVTSMQTFNEGVNIRGFGVGLLRNGAPARGTNKGMPLYDVERVEIIKGPSAMLTGFNTAIGGAVNYISRKPTATLAGDAKVTVGENGYFRFQGNLSGPVRKTENFAANYRASIGSSDGSTDREMDVIDDKYFGAAFDLYFGDRTSIGINASYFQNNNDMYPSDFVDITVTADSFTKLIPSTLNQHSSSSFSPGRNRDAFWDIDSRALDVSFLSKLTDDLNLRAVYFYAEHDDSRRNIAGVSVLPDNHTLTRQDVRNDNGVEAHSFQIDLLHAFEHRLFKLESTVGVDGMINYSYTLQAIPAMPNLDTRNPTFPDDDAHFAKYPNDEAYWALPGTNNRGESKSLSYYFQENLSLLKDRVILVGGLRWFSSNSVSENRKTNVTTRSTQDPFRVYKYGVVVKIIPQLSLYYTDAENIFLQSGLTDRFSPGDGLGAPLDNQRGKLSEYGAKYDIKLHDKVTVYGSIAYFDMALTNVRTFGVLPESPTGATGIIQSEQDSAEGWEADFGARLTHSSGHADLILTYFNADSAIASDAGLPYVRQANFFVPQKYSALVKYTWTSGPLKNLMIGGGVATQSDFRSGSYLVSTPTVASLFGSYQFLRNWNVQVNLDNITNERYFIRVYQSGSAQTADMFEPRMTVGYNW